MSELHLHYPPRNSNYVSLIVTCYSYLGEGAAIACGASVFGLGSDIGGSLRIPAAWNGIAALKPTAGRLSSLRRKAVNDGQTAGKRVW